MAKNTNVAQALWGLHKKYYVIFKKPGKKEQTYALCPLGMVVFGLFWSTLVTRMRKTRLPVLAVWEKTISWWHHPGTAALQGLPEVL